MITRENIKQYILQIKQKEGDETISNRWQPDILVEVIDQIYDEHEAQLKTLDDKYAEAVYIYESAVMEFHEKMKAKDDEIERLKAIVEEAIRKPMGVEPHSWSDYKMKDKE